MGKEVVCNHRIVNMGYVEWAEWAYLKRRKGHIQRQCVNCELWLFKCEE